MLPLIAALMAFLSMIFFFWTEFLGAGWQPCPRNSVRRMLELSKASYGKLLYDLGAGDGRIIISAAKDFGCRAVGVEIDPLRFFLCWLRIRKNGLDAKGKTISGKGNTHSFTGSGFRGSARIIFGNIYNVSLGNADIVTIYLRDWSNEKLKKKLLNELKKGAKVVTYHWPFRGWNPVETDEERKVWVYEIGKL